MKIRTIRLWETTRSSYWFVPAMMVIASIILSWITLAIDNRVTGRPAGIFGNLFLVTPEGTPWLLSAIAGSMITVASLTFSITVVAVSQATTLFGPLVLRKFMRDVGNQVVLGTFIATFLFSLLALRAFQGGSSSQAVPYFSVWAALILALTSMCVLIYFIHHATLSLYAPHVISSVAHELINAIDHLPTGQQLSVDGPAEVEDGLQQQQKKVEQEVRLYPRSEADILAPKSGYLQAIDLDSLVTLASQNDCIMQILHRPGHFVLKDRPLAHVWTPDRTSSFQNQVFEQTFLIGDQRVVSLDVEFAFEQLVEITVRALSPSVNDPYTAITCLDWLAVALISLSSKHLPKPYYFDPHGKPRLILQFPLSFERVANATLNHIRQSVGPNIAARIRLLEAIAAVSEQIDNETDRQALIRQATMIAKDEQAGVYEPEDQADLDKRYQQVLGKVRLGEEEFPLPPDSSQSING